MQEISAYKNKYKQAAFCSTSGIWLFGGQNFRLGPDGQRLAKQHGSVTLAERLSMGESPQQVRAWMANSLGLAHSGEEPSLDELLARFHPAKLPQEPTVWTGRSLA
ncbi:hypothetical protein BH23ACT11_BH23ACT11_27440 [soil metagenome]